MQGNRIRIPMLSAATSGTGGPIQVQAQDELVFYLTSSGTTSGGTIIIEEADYDPNGPVYAGTWSQIASIAASTFTGGAQVAYHVSPNAYGFVRARISSAITGGGSISITLVLQ
jgi:hypothetical protein